MKRIIPIAFGCFLWVAFSLPPALADNNPLIKPPKKLKVESSSPNQVSLSWERDQGLIDETIHYRIYQKFYSNYSEYFGYNGYAGYFIPIPPDRVQIKKVRMGDLVRDTLPPTPEPSVDRFPAALYNDMPYDDKQSIQRARRSSLVSYYRMFDEIVVEGSSGLNAHYGSYGGYNSYDSYYTFTSYWNYTEDKVNYTLLNAPPEQTDFDEVRRRTTDPVFKIVAIQPTNFPIAERSLASSESEGRRLIGQTSRQTLPAPEDVTVRLLDNGNVRLDWNSFDPQDYGFQSVLHKIYQNSYSIYGTYQYQTYGGYSAYFYYGCCSSSYGRYQSYSNFDLLGAIQSDVGGNQSYEILASKVKSGVHEFSSVFWFNPLGVYKIITTLPPKSSSRYANSPASPESNYAGPEITVEGGTFHSACVGQGVMFSVSAQNALAQPIIARTSDVGGSGVDVDVFQGSPENLYPAVFIPNGVDWLFIWIPSHPVDDEVVRFVATDDGLTKEQAKIDVTIQTENC